VLPHIKKQKPELKNLRMKLQYWKEFIKEKLLDSGKYYLATTEYKGETETEVYKSSEINSQSEIRVGYLPNNLLIFIQNFNPKTKGYNKYAQIEYFYCTDYDENSTRKDIGLTFKEINLSGISELLISGIIGNETQFILNKKIMKSILCLEREEYFYLRFDFTERSFWKRVFSRRVERMKGIEKVEINLKDVFSGT